MRVPFPVDFGRAVFAVALAVLLYFVALSETNPADQRKTQFTVPVQVVNATPGLVVITQPSPVQLYVTAPLNVFDRLRAESFTAQVDATGGAVGDNTLPITVTSTDPDVRSVQADPPQVVIRLEEVTNR